jgi:hypothetical protein
MKNIIFITIITILLLFITINEGTPIKSIAHIIKHIYCPYNGFYGIACKVPIHKRKYNNELPILLSTWDPVKGQVRLPIYETDFSKGKTYTTNTGKIYRVPNSYDLIKKDITIPYRTTTSYHFPSKYFNKFNINRSTVLGGIFAKGKDYSNLIMDNFNSGKNTMTITSEYHYGYQISYNTNKLRLSSAFETIIDYLPKKYNPIIYSEFIEYFGTHIITSGYAGGLAQQISNIRECYYSGSTINLNDQAELAMLKKLYNKEYANVKFKGSYLNYAKSNTINIFGGNPIYVNNDEWNERMNSFEDYPVLVNVTVKPIIDIIVDPIIRSNLEKAINGYLNTGKLYIDNLINKWNEEWNKPKLVVAYSSFELWNPFGFGLPPNEERSVVSIPHFTINNNVINNLSVNGTLDIKHCSLNGGRFANAVHEWYCMELLGQFSKVTCNRDSEGKVYAKWEYTNPIYNKIINYVNHPSFHLQIITVEGKHVKKGFSVVKAIMTVNSVGRVTVRHYCSTNNVEAQSVRRANGWCRVLFGYFVPQCPKI